MQGQARGIPTRPLKLGPLAKARSGGLFSLKLPLSRPAFRARRSLASILVRLPTGGALAVEEYGDSAGPPVLYFHGWPASRLEAGLIPSLPVRLLAIDRPGYGRSTPQPGRTLLDWPRDVAIVADRLGLAQFYIVGLSGGAPFAAACAYAMPDRVLGVALVSPVPPADSVARRAPGVGHLFRLGRHPRVAHRLLSMMRPLLRRRIITPSTLVGGAITQSDRDVLTDDTLAGLGRAWREGMGRSVLGAVADATLYARDWGFSLADIRVPAAMWFGEEDTLIRPEAALAYAAIPGIVMHRLAGEGHYSLALRTADRILRELVKS